MIDFIIIVSVAAILLLAAGYIRKKKKSGVKCVGCPHSGSCSSCGCSGK